jgi:gliding motility-associated-like protein
MMTFLNRIIHSYPLKGKLTLCLFAFIFYSIPIFATHIVGGEIGYRCLGNNNFEITLRVFRDCFNGSDGAYFDDPATIGVFNREGILISTFTLSPIGNDTLSEGADPCLIISRPVCVHTTTYKDTINLAPRLGGYRFVYQRCCRNQTIVNIINPLETGATYDILLTHAAMIDCNASPIINSWPPVYVCNNRPLVVNSKATDENFDSLVYKFCTPFQGATFAIPKPVPPDGPPFDTVVWVNPTYNLSNMLGGTFPLVIDSKTGIMTGVPQIQGQFVVGVCIEEYDKVTKTLLSTTRRDFQYNVVHCTGSNASFSLSEKICRNSEVIVFRENPEATTYEWYLGEGEDRELISRDFLIKLKFDEIGTYVLTLVTDKGLFCESTLSRRFEVVGNEVDFTIQKQDFLCENFSRFTLKDVSMSNAQTSLSYLWTVNFGNSVLSSNLKNPVFDIPLGASGTVSLKVFHLLNCADSLTKPFITVPPSGSDFGLSSEKVDPCLDSLRLSANASRPVNQFLWLSADGSVLFSGRSFHLSWSARRPSRLVAINELGCRDTLLLSLADIKYLPFTPIYRDSLVFCDSVSKKLIPDFFNPLDSISFKWTSALSPVMDDSSFAPTFKYPSRESFVYLKMSNVQGCEKLDSVRLIRGNILLLDPLPRDTLPVCAKNDFPLSLKTNSSPYSNKYLWTPANIIKQGQGTPSVVVSTENSTSLQVSISNNVGCAASRNFPLKVQKFDPALDTNFLVCSQSPVVLNTGFNPSYAYSWSPGLGLSNQTIGNPTFLSPISRNYSVTVTNPQNNCQVFREVRVKKGLVRPSDIGKDTIVCNVNNLPLIVKNPAGLLTYTWSGNANFREILGVGTSLLAGLKPGENRFFVKARDTLGCNSIDSIAVRAAPIKATMPASLKLCQFPDTALLKVLHEDTLQQLSYDWFPKNNFFTNPLNSAVGRFLMRDSGVIRVVINNQFGCKAELSSLVSFSNGGIPVIFSAGKDSTLCQYDNRVLRINTNISVKIDWAKDPSFKTIAFSGNNFNYSPQRGVNTLYVRGENADKCKYFDTLNLRVFPVEASLPVAYNACIPSDTLILKVIDQDTSQFLNYLWAPNGIIKSDPLEGPVARAQISKDTVASVLLINKFGCSTTLRSKLILVNPLVTISSDKETLIKNKGEKAILKVSGCVGCQYLWSPFNTLSSFTDSIVTATPNDTTLYRVVASKQGCSATASIRINVDDVQCEEPNIFVPNAFTPNNDGINDLLLVRGRWITSLRFVVYNRYGQEIFVSTKQSDGWNGIFKAKELSPDVFGYFLSVRCVDGENFVKRGNVTLIR